MNIDYLIAGILDISPLKRQQNIKTMSSKIINQLGQLDQLEKDKKTHEKKKLFQAFFKIIQNIANEVHETKQKYENLDKQKLKQQKCISLAKDIKLFKEECFYLRNKLKQTKKDLKNIRRQNELIESQHSILQRVYENKSKQKQKIKYKTLSQFWFSKDQQRVNTTQNKRRSKLSFDATLNTKAAINLDEKNQGEHPLKRFISSSQQTRKYESCGSNSKQNQSGSQKRLSKKWMNLRIHHNG